jgi:hypothetical protein
LNGGSLATLRQWTLLSPRKAAEEYLAAAEEVDALIGSLEADAVSEVVGAGRERLVEKRRHPQPRLGRTDRLRSRRAPEVVEVQMSTPVLIGRWRSGPVNVGARGQPGGASRT